MKRLIITLIALSLGIMAHAQVAVQVAGATTRAAGYRFSYTIGQALPGGLARVYKAPSQSQTQPPKAEVAPENQLFGARLYPNPATEYVRIDFFGIDPDQVYVNLYDAQGRSVLQRIGWQWVQQGPTSTIEVQIQGLPTGQYHVQLASLAGGGRPFGFTFLKQQ